MIGVAFGIHETFGAANDIERVALARVASQLARAHDFGAEAAILERLAETPDAAFAAPSAARSVLFAVLGPALSAQVSGAAIEGLVRGAGARAASELFVPDLGVAEVLRSLSELNVPRAGLSLRWPGVDHHKANIACFDGETVYAGDATTEDSALAPFIRLTAALRLPADRIFFVGTDPWAELHPAALVGMRAIRLDREGTPYPADLPPPEFTISAIEEVLPILSGPYTQGLLALRLIMRTALEWRDGHFVPTDANVLPETPDTEEG